MKKTIFLLGACCLLHAGIYAQDWRTTGNAGTTPGTNFIGTTDNQGLSFRTNNVGRLRISPGGNLGIGTVSPLQKLDVAGNINLGAGFSLFMENKRVLRIDSVKCNLFLGNGSGAVISGGVFNTATGYYTLASVTSGNYNAAYGMESLRFNTTGSSNAAVGTYALRFNISGVANTAMGTNALYNNSTGWYNTAIGNNTLLSSTGSSYNTALGADALTATTGGYNTATGYRALFTNTTGYDNVASGYSSLSGNTTGALNTAVGMHALWTNTYGNYNTAMGDFALGSTTGSSYNAAFGDLAGATWNNGWNNTFIGAMADASLANIYNSIALGNISKVTASNQVRIGNSFTTSIGGYAGWSTISDERVKKNIKDNVPGLAFINKLKAVTYNLDLDASDKLLQNPAAKQKTDRQEALSQAMADARKQKQEVVYTGFLAQQVEKAAKELNYDFSGVDAAKNDKDLYSLRYAEFVVPLVKAVQELSQKVEKLEAALAQTSAASVSDITSKTVSVTSASLAQNVPNPFNKTTTINYTLPQQYNSAKIILTDNNGRTIKEINVSGSKGNIVLDTAAIASGAYHYALYVDGRLIQSKQMLLTK